MKNIVTINYKVITPMFLGGENQEKKAELRAPSIKGALRFWYRAIDSNYRQHEMRIFGGTDEGVGQSKFLLRIENSIINHQNGLTNTLKTLAYGAENRNYIKTGETFRLKLIFKPNTNEEDILRVKRALWAFTMLGGLGTRSRKGFGSLRVTSSTEMDELPSLTPKVSELKETLKLFTSEHINLNTDSLPEYTCWSTQSQCILTGKANHSGLNSLEWLSSKIHDLRSTQGENHFYWADDDCKKMKDFSKGITPNSPPLRAAFGLPHNYFFKDEQIKKVDINFMENGKKGRRASPLFLHIYEKDDKNSCVIATFLPARLIPANEQVTITAGHREVNLDLPNNFQAITDLLDEFKTQAYQGEAVTP